MPSVTINDVEMEAKVGERLLNVARRNAAHIGFVCDGNGVCQTCQLTVQAGAEHLSPPNEAEQTWISAGRLAEGHRLACQAVLRGPGPVVALTTVEELRRQALHALRPSDREDLRDRVRPLLEQIVRLSADQLARYPWNILATLGRVGLGRFILPLRNTERWLDDGARVARRMVAGAERIERAPAAPSSAIPPAASAATLDTGATPPAPRPVPAPSPQAAAEARAVAAARALRRARSDAARARR